LITQPDKPNLHQHKNQSRKHHGRAIIVLYLRRRNNQFLVAYLVCRRHTNVTEIHSIRKKANNF